MSITFKTSDSLIRLGILSISLFEVLLLLSGTCKFPFVTKFPTVLELQEFAGIFCKVSNIFLDNILIWWVVCFYPFIYGLKSKRLALSLSGQWQFICLKWANQFLDFDIIKIFALFNCYHLGAEAFRQWPKDLPYYLGILCFLSQIKLADDHFIQFTIERVKGLVLTHSELLKSGGQHL